MLHRTAGSYCSGLLPRPRVPRTGGAKPTNDDFPVATVAISVTISLTTTVTMIVTILGIITIDIVILVVTVLVLFFSCLQ